MTVRDLKELFLQELKNDMQNTNILSDKNYNIRLIHSGKLLQDKDKLSDLNIDNVVIQGMVSELRGGKKTRKNRRKSTRKNKRKIKRRKTHRKK